MSTLRRPTNSGTNTDPTAGSMIGNQPTGNIDGVVISAVTHEGLSVTVDGRPGRLAVVTEDGQVVAMGQQVAREVRNVAVNCYRSMLMGQGHLRVMSPPIAHCKQANG